MQPIADIHFCWRHRLIMMGDSLALVLPFAAWLAGNYFVALLVLNIMVPYATVLAICNGVETFRHWQGRWRCAEIPWIISLSTITCFMMLVLTADWYIKRGWNLIGIYDNMMWDYVHYCSARAICVFHKYVRKYG